MIERIGIDADDTLWDEASGFLAAENEFVHTIEGWTGMSNMRHRLRAHHFSRLDRVGYGAAAYRNVLCEFSRNELPQEFVSKAVGLANTLCVNVLRHPVTVLPGVRESLVILKEIAELVLITKGNDAVQRAKLDASGLEAVFSEVYVVGEKTVQTYVQAFGQSRIGPHAAMIGNSLKSDIIPALAAGALGIFVPHAHETPLEKAEKPLDHPHFQECSTILDAAYWLQTYQSRAF
jgi:putative hydrolase of the HAD superfamily